MTQPKGFRTANKRYVLLFWPMMAFYVAFIFGGRSFIDEESAPLWLKAAGGLAVALPLLGVLYAVRRLTEETDEYTRMRHLRALRDGGLLTVAALFLTGFLQVFGALASFPVFWFGVFFFIAYGLSAAMHKLGPTV